MSSRSAPIARKEYYSIGEVCDLVGLRPHVLRYWESQFPSLNPSKNRSGNRVYLRREIEHILLVKELLHEEKYTIEGARQRLRRMREGGELPEATAAAAGRGLLVELRRDLKGVHDLLSLDSENS